MYKNNSSGESTNNSKGNRTRCSLIASKVWTFRIDYHKVSFIVSSYILRCKRCIKEAVVLSHLAPGHQNIQSFSNSNPSKHFLTSCQPTNQPNRQHDVLLQARPWYFVHCQQAWRHSRRWLHRHADRHSWRRLHRHAYRHSRRRLHC
ncbi:hypothetical protein GT037_004286 [Alternaria burnsii]|uniref:Uncharacterized protein n=1 Tax=Alternaria burnsii TaxID=1187904 RepID=A0A8H7B6S8_9PLEO|nr:uncharacterized protein GT037_004286 [Alternaria burnsii]KAF7677427.1 hypothetical protein GT037_004286 [Alternaria burnsii]